ncbi:hypothetical protein L7F22_009908 [Adiantum nelumboides]|nr:hypothetical protein [Adiantum nelumboides]
MIFVKDSLNGVNETQVSENGMQVDFELSNFLNQFQDVFIDDIPGELPPKQGADYHTIELIPGSSPPNKPPYRVSQAQQEEIMRQVNELVEKGMVRPSSSPFCSPVLLVQKKDDTYRMCVDYRALNRITIKNRFPVPRVEDLFDKLQSSTYFSRIDLKSGYHQIRIVAEDIVKTAFRITFGLCEYLVMPFGLTNAPATFNHMMERIFHPHRNFTGVFFDDVIIYFKTIEEHKEHLRVLEMASNKSNLSSVYPQRKKTAGDGKKKGSPGDSVRSALQETCMSTASLGSSKSQPAALMSSSGMDLHDDYDDLEETLRQFDMNMHYGPCLGMTRIERWERANKLGMNPPIEVKEILERVNGAPACLWEGRV